jgi:hypothetical protein
MLRWRKTLSLLERAFCIDQVLHPHNSSFMGIVQKQSYLPKVSRWGEFQTFLRAPVEWMAAVTDFLML